MDKGKLLNHERRAEVSEAAEGEGSSEQKEGLGPDIPVRIGAKFTVRHSDPGVAKGPIY